LGFPREGRSETTDGRDVFFWVRRSGRTGHRRERGLREPATIVDEGLPERRPFFCLKKVVLSRGFQLDVGKRQKKRGVRVSVLSCPGTGEAEFRGIRGPFPVKHVKNGRTHPKGLTEIPHFVARGLQKGGKEKRRKQKRVRGPTWGANSH